MSGPSPIKMEDTFDPVSTPPEGGVMGGGINPNMPPASSSSTGGSTIAAGGGAKNILMLQKRNLYFKQHGLDASNPTLISKYVDYLKTHDNQEPPVSLFQTTAIMPPTSSLSGSLPPSSSSSVASINSSGSGGGGPNSSGSVGTAASGGSGSSSGGAGGSLEKQMSSLISIVKAAHQLDLTNRKADVYQTMQSILASQPQQPVMLQGLMCPQRLPSSSSSSSHGPTSSSQPHPSHPNNNSNNSGAFPNQSHGMSSSGIGGQPGRSQGGPGGLANNDRPGQNGPNDTGGMGTPPQPKGAGGRKKNEPASGPRKTKDANSPTLASLAGGMVPNLQSPLTPANSAATSTAAGAMGSMANNAAIINAANAAATANAAAAAAAAAASARGIGAIGGRGATNTGVGGLSHKELLKYAATESESRQQQLLQNWQQRKSSQADAHQFYFQTPELVKKLATITTAHGLNLPRDNEGLALVELFTLGLENHLKNLVQSIRHASRRRMDFCKEWGGSNLMQITNEPKKEHQEAQKKWEEKQQRWNKFQEGKSGSTGASTTTGAGAASLLPAAPEPALPSTSSFLPSTGGGLPPSTSSFLPSSSSFLPSSDLLPPSTGSFLPGSGGGLPASSLFDGAGLGSFSASPQPLSSLTMTVPDAVTVLSEHPHYRKSARLMKAISGLKRKDPPGTTAGTGPANKKEKATENKDNKDALVAPSTNLVSASPLSQLPPSPAVMSSLAAAVGGLPPTIGGLAAPAALFLPPSTSAAVESLGQAMQQ